MNAEWTAGLITLQNASELGTVLLHKSRFKRSLKTFSKIKHSQLLYILCLFIKNTFIIL